MLYPKLRRKSAKRLNINRFYGYDCNPGAADGCFADTRNISTALFPQLSTRGKRSTVRTLTCAQALAEKDALVWVDDGMLYCNSLPTAVTGLMPGEKQLVSMGAYLCIFPDKVYFNTANQSDWGSMEAYWSYTGTVSYALCDAEGGIYSNVTGGYEEPPAPDDGDYWLDSRDGVLSCWSADSEQWIRIDTVYTKLSFTTQGQLPAKFAQYDGVELSGTHESSLNGSKILYGIGGSAGTAPAFTDAEPDYIIVQGETLSAGSCGSERITLERRVPDMDYVCQCRNRLWGCRYGFTDEGTVNELYACALGDFRNWNQFMGLSTDSWTAGVGSDGVWTGAVNYLGTPVFFKENCLHRISVSAVGAHQVDETVCRGVEKGSGKSLAVVNETLFYKSPRDICAYQGGFPESVSAALGAKRYHAAAAGTVGQCYYISMLDENDMPSLFVYDMVHGLWSREDGLRAEYLAKADDRLFCLSDNKLISLTGGSGTEEEELMWSAETGPLCLDLKKEKYIRSISLRMAAEDSGECCVFVQYDSSGCWEPAGRIHGGRLPSVCSELPLRPRRCDHISIKLEGKGEMRLISLSLELTEG